MATGEIILFSDATTLYSEDVFRHLLPAFADENVGCVAGRLVYVDERKHECRQGRAELLVLRDVHQVRREPRLLADRRVGLFVCRSKIRV